MQHPISRAILERFTAGKASREENRAIVSHLLRGCEACSRILRKIERARVPIDGYGPAIDRFTREVRAEVEAPSGVLTVLREVLAKPGGRSVEPAAEEALVRFRR